jgi:uncharacterized protein (TIGR02996 family)
MLYRWLGRSDNAPWVRLAPKGTGLSGCIMSDDQSFLQAIRAAPAENHLRLVYADWLEERGDERGEYLRIQAKLLEGAEAGKSTKELQARYKELRLKIVPNWIQATDWPAPKPRIGIRCVFGIRHSWDGCVCSRCDAVNKDPMRHTWVGCKCIRCGQTREGAPVGTSVIVLGPRAQCSWPRKSCSGSGGKDRQCSICGVVLHNWGPWVDCSDENSLGHLQRRTCNHCSVTEEFIPGP